MKRIRPDGEEDPVMIREEAIVHRPGIGSGEISDRWRYTDEKKVFSDDHSFTGGSIIHALCMQKRR